MQSISPLSLVDTASLVGSYPIARQPCRERFSYFRAMVDQIFCPMQIESVRSIRETFDGTLDTLNCAQVSVARVSTAACTIRRRPDDIRRYADVRYLIKFQARGQSVWTQRGREIHLKPGDFVVSTTAEPYTLHFLDWYVMPVIALTPATMRRLTPDPEQFLGMRFPGQDPDCGLLSNFVADVASRLHGLREPLLGRIEANILDLLGAVLNARSANIAVSASERLAQVKAYVREHLCDPTLSPASVATTFNLSTRYLHSLFEAEPCTLGRYIRRQRVEACRAAIVTADSEATSCSDLALQWGFYDASHMTRAFRKELGITPSELRGRAHSAG